jgi:hypothetical protein
MSELEDSWQTVAGEFRTLGYAFRDHYRATKDTGDAAPSEEEVRNALHTVTDAVDTALTSVGKAIRDPSIQKNAKDAAGSLIDALGTSFTQLGEAIERALRKTRAGDATTETPETEQQPPSETATEEGPDPEA